MRTSDAPRESLPPVEKSAPALQREVEQEDFDARDRHRHSVNGRGRRYCCRVASRPRAQPRPTSEGSSFMARYPSVHARRLPHRLGRGLPPRRAPSSGARSNSSSRPASTTSTSSARAARATPSTRRASRRSRSAFWDEANGRPPDDRRDRAVDGQHRRAAADRLRHRASGVPDLAAVLGPAHRRRAAAVLRRRLRHVPGRRRSCTTTCRARSAS